MALTTRLLQKVSSLIERVGYEVHPKVDHFISDQITLLTNHVAPVDFDFRANSGKFARSYRARFPCARIVCLRSIPCLAARLREGQKEVQGHVEAIEAALSNADRAASLFLVSH